MNNLIDMRPCNAAIRAISNVLPKSKYEYRIVYSGKSIEILSKSDIEDTRIYIRVVTLTNGYAIDLANIDLDPSIQHKGVFTSIVNNLKKSRILTEIWVSSVLTPEMHNACKKLGMTPDSVIMGYKTLIR